MRLILQILVALTTILAVFPKEKWKMMLVYTINNILSIAMYLAFDRTASAWISLVATLRTIIFMIYAYKKIKPNLFWLIVFESGFVIATIITWQDALDLMIMFALLFVGYGSWQDNQIVLRVAYFIDKVLLVTYKAIIGAYVSMLVESFALIGTIVCLIYYCILKKETPILELLFKRKKTKQKIETDIVQ